jgi:hypothetical protein
MFDVTLVTRHQSHACQEALAKIEDAIRGYLDLYSEPETRCEIREMEVVTAS